MLYNLLTLILLKKTFDTSRTNNARNKPTVPFTQCFQLCIRNTLSVIHAADAINFPLVL